MLGTVLASHTSHIVDSSSSARDPRLMLAKSNLDRYLDILARAQGSAAFNTLRLERLAELNAIRSGIKIG